MLLLAGCGADAPAPASTSTSTSTSTTPSPAPVEKTATAPSAEAASPAVPAPDATLPALPPPDLASATPPTDAWLGKWIGPEGTFLELTRGEGGYDVLLQSLDGPAHYAGVPVDAHIEFTRAGKRESIQATDGPGTGMKWLADKHDCLVIQASEGFCRD
jgi:hypothetical protein